MRITSDDVRSRIASARNSDELRDAVHGVDPATLKASFKLFTKSEPPAPRTRTIPIEDHRGPRDTGHAPGSGPRVADEGEDSLGRPYDDSAFDRISEANGEGTARGDFPGAPRVPNFETAGGELQGPLSQYECEEVGEPGSRAVRVGPNFLASPRESGIPEPLNYRPSEPAPVAKRAPGTLAPNFGTGRVAKRRGMFTDIVNGPIAGSNFFSPQRVSKSEDEMDEVGSFGAGAIEYGDEE